MYSKREIIGEVDTKIGKVMAKSKKPKRLPQTHKDYCKERVEKITYRCKQTARR